MKYFVTIGSRVVEVEVDGDDVRCDGRPVRAHLEHHATGPELRLALDGEMHRLAVEGHADGIWRLVDAGAVREVAVEDERTRHIRSLAGAGKSLAAGGILKAPMPGLVVRIDVAVGDHVSLGAPLVVLEAMKMENELKATVSGRVATVHVEVGVAVEKGTILLEVISPE